MKIERKFVRNITIGLTALVFGLASTAVFAQDPSVNAKAEAAAAKAAVAGEKAAMAAEKAAVKAEKSVKFEQESRGFCSNNNWSNDDKVSINELRESVVAAGGTIAVDAGMNGGIGVKGEDRNDIVLRACVQAWGRNAEDARALASNILSSTLGS